MPTITASLAQSEISPKLLHAGTVTVIAPYTNGGSTLAGGTVIKFCKIPHGATITDGFFQADFSDDFSLRFGVLGDVARFHASDSCSAMIRWDIGLPYTVSVSDDAVNQFEWVTMNIANQVSDTFSCTMVVSYVLDR